MTSLPIYYYSFDYDKLKNEFYGHVETASGFSVFEIADIAELRQLIKDKKMKHIDDVDGLATLLKDENKISPKAVVRLLQI